MIGADAEEMRQLRDLWLVWVAFLNELFPLTPAPAINVEIDLYIENTRHPMPRNSTRSSQPGTTANTSPPQTASSTPRGN
jgi:hypothetical protein